VERPTAGTRTPDPGDAFIAQPVQDTLRGAVGVRRIRESRNCFLDTAGVLQPHHLAPGDACGVGVDLTRNAQQFTSDLDAAEWVPLEAIAQLLPATKVGHVHRLAIEIPFDPQRGTILQLEFESEAKMATLPGAPALASLDQRGSVAVRRLQPVEPGQDGLLQGGLAGLVGSHDQVHRRAEMDVDTPQRAEALDLDPRQAHRVVILRPLIARRHRVRVGGRGPLPHDPRPSPTAVPRAFAPFRRGW